MKVLVTGGGGLLGSELLRTPPAGVGLVAAVGDRPAPPGLAAHRLDLVDGGAVRRVLSRERPDVVIHTAYRNNRRDIVDASAEVAAAATAVGAAVVHLSSDVVFDGDQAPYAEGDPPSPVNHYGRHKAEAEHAVVAAAPGAAIVRTSLIVRLDPPDPVTAWLVEGLAARREVVLFDDEWRCPIALGDLAAMIWELVQMEASERAGCWHLVGPEALTRAALGRRLVASLGLDGRWLREAPSPAAVGAERRPRDLRLSDDRARGLLRHRPSPVGGVSPDRR